MALNTEKIENLIRKLLIEIGEDPQRDELIKTPNPIARSLAFSTSGWWPPLSSGFFGSPRQPGMRFCLWSPGRNCRL